jgi:putative acetyltransferase
MTVDIRIRPEIAADRAAIHAIHYRAFGQPAEADLVDRLRTEGDLVLSLVAVADQPAGHVAFSRLHLAGTDLRATALAPVAVLPEWQRREVGTALIRDGLARLRSAGEHLVLVLGDPAYYGRFGFTGEAARGLATPYDGPYLQALPLTDGRRSAVGPVTYARAFSELG